MISMASDSWLLTKPVPPQLRQARKVLNCSEGLILWRVISTTPNRLIFSIFALARSGFTARRNVFSTSLRCFSLRISIKSQMISPPRSLSLSCLAISSAALRFILKAVCSALCCWRYFPLFTSIATSASVCSMTIEPPVLRLTVWE